MRGKSSIHKTSSHYALEGAAKELETVKAQYSGMVHAREKWNMPQEDEIANRITNQ